ncbi:MAG TPA: hypothetical protein VME22_18700 [Solirubrobacteraceae bacterium]|nr:hypothetical protein [Solirubrobacteraceae bacterium]
MATLAQKIEAETKMRALLEDAGLPQPDHVEYGFTCIRFFFMETKTVVVIDIDQPENGDVDFEMDVPDDVGTDVAESERGRRGRRFG